jgi:PA14 domain
MLKLHRIALILAALFALNVFAVARPALADGMAIAPTAGTYATSYTVQVWDFNANEPVAIAAFLSDGAAVGLPGLNADGSGHITFTITPYGEWQEGMVVLNAAGTHSAHKYSASFQLVHDTPGSASVTPSSGTFATSYTVQGTGFISNEPVLVAAFLSDSTGVGLPAVSADSVGNIFFNLAPFGEWPAGQVTVVTTGVISLHKVSSAFQLAHDSSGLDTSEWYGEYFNNTTLTGDPAVTRTDAAVLFNWGLGSPEGVGADNFSARWTTTRNVSTAGNYSIQATADDGVRVWVDGQIVIDAWDDHSATQYSTTVFLGSGPHDLRVEYYEHTEKAVILVDIVRS